MSSYIEISGTDTVPPQNTNIDTSQNTSINTNQNTGLAPWMQDKSILNTSSLELGSSDPVPSIDDTPKYTLTDLRNDNEFQAAALRFMESVGSDEASVSEFFQYARDADWNLTDSIGRFANVKKWTQEQKNDYAYLMDKFNNAEVGSFNEWSQFGIDAIQAMGTDPTLWASVLLTPFTGGGSLATRIAGGKAAQTGLTKILNQNIASQVTTNVNRLAPKTWSSGQAYSLASVEGASIAGGHDVTRQMTELETGMKEEYSPLSTAVSITGGAILAPAALFGMDKLSAKISKSLDQRAARKESELADSMSDEEYIRMKQSELIDHQEVKLNNFERNTTIDNWDVYNETTSRVDKALSYFISKPTAYLKELAYKSETLQILLPKIRHDALKTFGFGKRGEIGDEYIDRWDFDEELNAFKGPLHNRLKRALEPLYTRGGIQQNFTYDIDVGDPFNIELIRKTRDADYIIDETFSLQDQAKIVKAATEIRSIYDEIKIEADRVGLEIDDVTDFIPRVWNPKAIQKNRQEFQNLLIDSGEVKAKIDSGYPEYQNKTDVQVADEIIETMLNVKEGLSTPEGSIKGTRTLDKINDNNFEKFLSNDIRTLTHNYITSTTMKIQRQESYGINWKAFSKDEMQEVQRYFEKNGMEFLGDFQDQVVYKWIRPIEEELAQAGKKLTEADKVRLLTLLAHQTNTDMKHPKISNLRFSSATINNLINSSLLLQQLNKLPEATLTSIAEPIIAMSTAGLSKTISGFSEASSAQASKKLGKTKIDTTIFSEEDIGFQNILRNLGELDEKTLHQFREETYRASEEVWEKLRAQKAEVEELQELGVALELGLSERIEGLYGEGMTGLPREISTGFFKTILLDAWTRTSQVAAYITGKNHIINVAKQLATKEFDKIGSHFVPQKNAINRLNEEARRLGLDPEELVSWYNRGADLSDDYFLNIKRGAVRFQGETIMSPRTVASQKPLIYGGKLSKLFTQLGSFPVAYSNTALKNMARHLIRYPVQNSMPVVGTIGTLYLFGDLINMIKSGGTHKDLPPEERARKNIERVGLGTIAGDAYLRAEKDFEYNENLLFSYMKGLGGPFTSEVIDMVRYGTGGREVALTNAPFWHFYKKTDPETATTLLALARRADKTRGVLLDTPRREAEGGYTDPNARQEIKLGGEVNIPRTSSEPDEKIDKITGIPYNIQANMIDEEERGLPKKNERLENSMKRLGFGSLG